MSDKVSNKSSGHLHRNIIVNSDKQNSAQGSVFYVKQSDNPGRELVLKIYKNENLKSYLKEISVFKKLNELQKSVNKEVVGEGLVGFPEMISYIEGSKSAEILMEALGPNLRKLLKQCPGNVFSKTTVYMITIQLIKRIRVLHQLGFVHNDLKLDNIIVGHKDPQQIYLIDFGLTCRYLEDDGSHSKKKYIEKFSGNFLFASLNSCRGNNKSRRDDVQCAMYIMVYLLNKNYLPWSDFHKKFKDTNYEFKDFLRERLEIKYTKEVFRIIPKDLRDIFKKVFTLQFEEEPPYDYILSTIKNELQKDVQLGPHNQTISHKFEWTHNVASRVKANILQEDNSYHSEQSSISDKLFIDQIRSKKLEALDGNMSMGAGSVRMRNQLMESQSEAHSERGSENIHANNGGSQHMDPGDSQEEGSPGCRKGSDRGYSPDDELKNARGRSMSNNKHSEQNRRISFFGKQNFSKLRKSQFANVKSSERNAAGASDDEHHINLSNQKFPRQKLQSSGNPGFENVGGINSGQMNLDVQQIGSDQLSLEADGGGILVDSSGCQHKGQLILSASDASPISQQQLGLGQNNGGDRQGFSQPGIQSIQPLGARVLPGNSRFDQQIIASVSDASSSGMKNQRDEQKPPPQLKIENKQIFQQNPDSHQEDNEEDQMSDYIDENFDLDETDEYWGTQRNQCHQLLAQINHIKHIDQKTEYLKDNKQLKLLAGYNYKEERLNASLKEAELQEEEKSRRLSELQLARQRIIQASQNQVANQSNQLPRIQQSQFEQPINNPLLQPNIPPIYYQPGLQQIPNHEPGVLGPCQPIGLGRPGEKFGQKIPSSPFNPNMNIPPFNQQHYIPSIPIPPLSVFQNQQSFNQNNYDQGLRNQQNHLVNHNLLNSNMQQNLHNNQLHNHNNHQNIQNFYIIQNKKE